MGALTLSEYFIAVNGNKLDDDEGNGVEEEDLRRSKRRPSVVRWQGEANKGPLAPLLWAVLMQLFSSMGARFRGTLTYHRMTCNLAPFMSTAEQQSYLGAARKTSLNTKDPEFESSLTVANVASCKERAERRQEKMSLQEEANLKIPQSEEPGEGI